MRKYDVVLFDLDGTLTASGEGITKSVQYALNKMGKEEMGKDLKALEVFIGPPLLKQFMAFCDITEDEAELAVKYYRERYTVTGIFENHPYPGVEELLKRLKEKGYLLCVASSKPDYMVHIVLEHFHLEQYFDVIWGSDINRPKMTKTQVIELVLEELGYKDQKEKAVMVGDRSHDVEGANQVGISCIGVTYGYGNQEELTQAGAWKIAETVEEIEEILEGK